MRQNSNTSQCNPDLLLGSSSVSRITLIHRRRKGVTLIEAAMVLSILAVFIAGVMTFYTTADGSRKTSTAISELGAIQQGIRSLYASQATYAGVGNGILTNTDLLPAKMIDGANIRHSLNGLVTVAPANTGGGVGSGYSVEFTNIPIDACTKMATQDLGRGLFSIAIGGNTRSINGTPPPFDPQTAGTSCSQANNTITWIFR